MSHLHLSVSYYHSYSPVLPRAYELQQPTSRPYKANRARLVARLDKLESEVRKELARQGFDGSTGKGGGRVEVERMMNMRFDGTDTALMVLPTQEEVLEGGQGEDFEKAFKRAYKAKFGFLLEGKSVIVDDVKVSVLQVIPDYNLSFACSPRFAAMVKHTTPSVQPSTPKCVPSRRTLSIRPRLIRVIVSTSTKLVESKIRLCIYLSRLRWAALWRGLGWSLMTHRQFSSCQVRKR